VNAIGIGDSADLGCSSNYKSENLLD